MFVPGLRNTSLFASLSALGIAVGWLFRRHSSDDFKVACAGAVVLGIVGAITTWRRSAHRRYGLRAEKQALKWLASNLPAGYQLKTNVMLRHGGNVDGFITGHGHRILVEIKSYHGIEARRLVKQNGQRISTDIMRQMGHQIDQTWPTIAVLWCPWAQHASLSFHAGIYFANGQQSLLNLLSLNT